MFRNLLARTGGCLTLALCVTAAAQAPLPKEVTVNGVEFVLIPAGEFYKTGGLPEPGTEFVRQDEYGGGSVKVWLGDYYIAKYEARARHLVDYLNSRDGAVERYIGDFISCSVRRGADGRYIPFRQDEDHPATHLSWDMADRWAKWMGFRLPTEAEWEKAARGTDKRTYPWGDAWPDETYAGFFTHSDCFTWPVDMFRKGVSPYGVYNMAGNVREYVADWYNFDYDRKLADGTRNPMPAAPGDPGVMGGGPWKMLKGGRWGSDHAQLRIGARIHYLPDIAFRCNGTRFGLDAAAVREHLARGTASVTKP